MLITVSLSNPVSTKLYLKNLVTFLGFPNANSQSYGHSNTFDPGSSNQQYMQGNSEISRMYKTLPLLPDQVNIQLCWINTNCYSFWSHRDIIIQTTKDLLTIVFICRAVEAAQLTFKWLTVLCILQILLRLEISQHTTTLLATIFTRPSFTNTRFMMPMVSSPHMEV